MQTSTASEPARADAERRDRRCAECGYGIAARHEPPRCPMCGGRRWLPLAHDRGRRPGAREPAGRSEVRS